jgi:hypothetical protein
MPTDNFRHILRISKYDHESGHQVFEQLIWQHVADLRCCERRCKHADVGSSRGLDHTFERHRWFKDNGFRRGMVRREPP